MKVAVLGTGMVGQALAGKLAELGHAVTMGTRDPKATLARTAPDGMGTAPLKGFLDAHPQVKLATFADAAAGAELLVNATSGRGALEALQLAKEHLAGKVLIDISNPLDFSKGMPPTLTVCNTDSLGEQLQRAFPALKVVKTLNTVNAHLMVNPTALAGGAHTMFVCGDDAAAKQQVTGLLQRFGWTDVLDLGGIANARATEMYLATWVRLYGTLKTPMFSIKVVR
ncbi:MAG: NAD(P)-binding domain-containing protein [Myxococcaceae bacterium]|nr:NAD(P)-binding domain-containing protein [Myxococcaceae bacterium]